CQLAESFSRQADASASPACWKERRLGISAFREERNKTFLLAKKIQGLCSFRFLFNSLHEFFCRTIPLLLQVPIIDGRFNQPYDIPSWFQLNLNIRDFNIHIRCEFRFDFKVIIERIPLPFCQLNIKSDPRFILKSLSSIHADDI